MSLGWRRWRASLRSELSAAAAGALTPLGDNERAAALAVLRQDAGNGGRFPGDRLSALRVTPRPYDPRSEAVLVFEPGVATLEVDPRAPAHVHERLLPMLPFLSVAARRLTHRGSLGLCLRDVGEPGRLAFCDRDNRLLLPDPFFWGSAGYAAERRLYARSPPWRRRSPTVLWRGTTTGPMDVAWRELPRARLCRLARDAGEDLGLDAGFTEIVQQPRAAAAEIQAEGLMRPWIDPKRFGDYRFHIDIDGNSNSWGGLVLKLLSGGLVFKVASPEGFRQWYYRRLEPWLHYVPVDPTLADLEEKVRWAHAHPQRAAEIAASGRRFIDGASLSAEADVALAVIETALASPSDLEPVP